MDENDAAPAEETPEPEATGPEGTEPEPKEAPPAAKKPAPPPPPAKLKRKVKIDGKEEEIEASEDELWAALRKSKTADRRFEEAAQAKKAAETRAAEVETHLAALKEKKDPIGSIAKMLGVDRAAARGLWEGALYEEYQAEPKDEKEAEIRDLKRQIQEREDAERSAAEKKKADEEKAKKDAETKTLIAEWDKKFTAALADPEVALPRTDSTLKYMAEYMAASAKHGYEPEPREVALAVRERFDKEVDAVVGSMTYKDVLTRFPQVAKLVRQGDLARIKAKRNGQAEPEAAPPAASGARDPNTGQFLGKQTEAKPAPKKEKWDGPTTPDGKKIVSGAAWRDF